MVSINFVNGKYEVVLNSGIILSLTKEEFEALKEGLKES